MARRISWLVLPSLLFVAATAVGDWQYRAFLPMVASPFQAKKCFAWANAPEVPEQAVVAGAECYHNWTIGSGSSDLPELQVFWSTYRFGTDMLARLRWLESTDWGSAMLYARRPMVLFLNEPDLQSQASLSPEEAAEVYLLAREACPSCVFFGPGVSAWDAHCDWPEYERQPYHDEIRGWGRWCYWQEFWHQVTQLNSVAAIEGREYASVHHYDAVAWHQPRRNVAPLQPVDELAALGAKQFLITEYGSCDPAFMAEMVAAYEADRRVMAHFVWTPQLRPVADWPTCEVLFEYGTLELTAVGRAWRDG